MIYYVQINQGGMPDIPALREKKTMYKAVKAQQLTFEGFNQSCGMKLNREDEWVRIADAINWDAIEERYRQKFPSKRGRPAATARIALGAVIIQKRMNLGDRPLVKEVARNPYYQYFLGLESYQTECPFKHGVLTEFRRRIDMEFLMEVNELLLKDSKATPEHAEDKQEEPSVNGNVGTMILDATCSPVNIRFPQDFSLLNEAREKLDAMIDELHDPKTEKRRPRTYRKVLRKRYLGVAKAKKRTKKQMRSIIRVMLCAVKRNMDFVDAYLEAGRTPGSDRMEQLATIRELYRQQKEMFDEKKHRVENRIVSISQPFVRPIVRGKTKAPVEFGPKYDVSIDENGHARLEHAAFDPYNECTILVDVIERYKKRAGHYPKRVLVDQVYRTKENRRFCEERGIVMSGRQPGRPPKDAKERRGLEKKERRNDTDRIEIERFFSRDKRCCGAGLIMTKLSKTTLGAVALSVLVANLFGVPLPVLFLFYFMDTPEAGASCHFLEIEDEAA